MWFIPFAIRNMVLLCEPLDFGKNYGLRLIMKNSALF